MNKKAFRFALLALLVPIAAVVSSCAPTADVAMIGPIYPEYRGVVSVFTTRAQVPFGSVEIAQMVIREGDFGGLQAMIDLAKIEAATRGANAIFIQSQSSLPGSGTFIGNTYVPTSYQQLSVIAIRVP